MENIDGRPSEERPHLINVPLSELGEVRRGAMLDPNTDVTVTVEKSQNGEKLSALFNQPLKSTDLKRVLGNFTRLPYSVGNVSNIWGGFDEGLDFQSNTTAGLIKLYLDSNPVIHEQSKELGRVLESSDDTEFINRVARGIITQDQAWNSLLADPKFISDLKNEFTTGKYTGNEFEPEICNLIGNYLDLWDVIFAKSEGKKSFQFNSPQRTEIADRVMREVFKRHSKYQEFQRNQINERKSVKFSYSPLDTDGDVYFVDDGDNLEIVEDRNLLIIGSGNHSATIDFNDDGEVEIHPHQRNFVVPVLCYERGKNQRDLVPDLPESLDQDRLIVPKGNKIHVVYDRITDRINPLAGMIAVFDLMNLGTGGFNKSRIPAETLPFAAISEADKILKRRFFDRVEDASVNS